jgi:hypothetical protein
MAVRIFNERQRFNQAWLWILIIAVTCASIGVSGITYLEATTEDQKFESAIGLLIIVVVMTLIIVFIVNLELETKIDDRGIQYRFKPFVWNWQLLKPEDLTSATVVTYNPILDYGGWGYRIGVLGKGKALNIRGNKGIRIVKKNGKKLLIGTQRPDEAQAILHLMFNQDNH